MSEARSILIVGWYGTETVGDKAVLGAILSKIRSVNAIAEIHVASLYPPITHSTRAELGEQFRIVDTYSSQFDRSVRKCDYVIVGGGPLMHIRELDHIRYAFENAPPRATRHLWGCGIGPLETQPHLRCVKAIIAAADRLEFRDDASVRFAEEAGASGAKRIGDPSVEYVNSLKGELSTEGEEEILFFLRDLDPAYFRDKSAKDLGNLRIQLINSIRQFAEFCSSQGLRPVFGSMHSFTIGDDDRVLAREIADGLSSPAEVVQKPMSVRDVVESMLRARFVVCMRFHSVVFAHTLDRPFLAIDYTRGGKIFHFLSEVNLLENLLPVAEISAEVLMRRLGRKQALLIPK